MTIINTKIITDSISIFDDRITTLLLTCPYNTYIQLLQYPIFKSAIIHKKTNNLKELIEEIDNNIALPINFKNNTNKNLSKPLETSCIYAINELWNSTKKSLEVFNVEELDIETIANYLHPFQHIELLATSTNWWDEFLTINSPVAEINELITQIRMTLNKSYPILKRENEWHLPFIHCDEDPIDFTISYRLDNAQLSLNQAKKCSVSRCLNNNLSSHLIEDDIELCNHNKCLIALDHIARPLSKKEFNNNLELINFIKKKKIICNNLNHNGWITYRQELTMS